jgi:hypothetical protein
VISGGRGRLYMTLMKFTSDIEEVIFDLLLPADGHSWPDFPFIFIVLVHCLPMDAAIVILNYK